MSDRASGSFSELDNMSTEELEAILRLDSQLSEGEDGDAGLILYISELIVKRELENPTGRLPDVDRAWKVFNEKYRPCANGGRPLCEDGQDGAAEPAGAKSGSPAGRRGRGLIRAACIAAVVAALMLAATATSYALGYDLWGHVARWSKDAFVFISDTIILPSDPPQSSQNELSALQEALDEHGITVKLIPKYIPEGFKQTDLYVDDLPGSSFFTSLLENSEHSIVIDVVTNADIVLSDYEKDEGDPEIYETNGIKHYIMTNMGKYLAVWRTENYEGSISGLETRDELIKMIDSIYEE